jgi:hypothetical protein
MAILVGLRATDRPVPDEPIQDHIYKEPNLGFGRADIRVALARLHDAGWLSYEPIAYGVLGNALTERSIAHMRKLKISPIKQLPKANDSF